MKRKKIKTVLILLIIIVLCLSVGVYAGYTLTATEVTYTKADGTTVSVKEALDELRAKIPQTLAKRVEPGDYVTYTPDTANTSSIITELGNYSGNSSNTSSTLTQEAGLKWRVLDVVDGKVRLISATPTTKVTLYGYNGYNNAVYLLDKACKTLYSKAGYSENVQNLKIEDIQNKMSTDYTTINSSYGTTLSPTNKKYPSILAKEAGQIVDGETGILGLSEQTTPINQTAVTTASSWKVRYTYWSKSMSESDFTNPIYYDLFIKNKKEDGTYSNYSTYWLSSRCVCTDSYNAFLAVHYVDSDSVSALGLYNSNDDPHSLSCALRPIITLNSNVLVTTGDGTSATPYEIGL